MKSFSVRANRLFNAALGRGRGRVWGDRYHRRDLTNASQVRNALVYCLCNYKKHQHVTSGAPRIDPFSSARWLDGMSRLDPALQVHSSPKPTRDPTTWLLLAHPLRPLQPRDRSLGVPRAAGAPGAV
jgi:hypothetical protein